VKFGVVPETIAESQTADNKTRMILLSPLPFIFLVSLEPKKDRFGRPEKSETFRVLVVITESGINEPAAKGCPQKPTATAASPVILFSNY
jgi:hypothetical protein